jgi:hypothetical protein
VSSVTVGTLNEKVMGNKMEQVLGSKTELLAGVYTNITGGAKIETGLAIKIDRVAGPDKLQSPVLDLEGKSIVHAHGSLIKIEGGAALNEKAPLVNIFGDSKVFVKSGGSKLTLLPGSAKLESPDITLEATGSLTLKCGGSTIKMSGGLIEVKSSEVQCVGSSGRLNLGGNASITAGDIFLKGKVTET